MRKKLIEVALPLEAINTASAREKSIRHGHPSTLHLWWARRPLATCRDVLFASLVDDPDSDPDYRRPDGSLDEERAAAKRAELFDLITDLVQWDNSNNARVINRARAEIARCVASRKIETGDLKKDTVIYGANKGKAHPKGPVSGQGLTAWDVNCRAAPPEVVNAFLAEYAPPVLDPFCGGGSIPLEAQRLGLVAYASDLNPVAVLITKALIEIPPKFANLPPVNPEARERLATASYRGAAGLAEDVRYYGKWMRDEAHKRIGHLYPKVMVTEEMAKERPDLKEYVGEELTVIAWLWARTVASPNPVCKGAHVPLVSSLLLSTKEGKKVWAEVTRDSSALDGWQFRVRSGNISKEAETKARLGTKAGKAKDFICTLTGAPITRPYIQAEGKADRLAVRLMAVVCEGRRARIYLSPDEHSEAVASSANKMKIVEETRHSFLSGATPTRAMITGGVCSAYGLRTWGHLFTPRQLVALTTFNDLLREVRERVSRDTSAGLPNDDRPLAEGGTGAAAYADAVATYLGICASKLSVFLTTMARWRAGEGKSAPAFGRQAFPMVWDFVDLNPFAGAGGDFLGIVDGARKTLLGIPALPAGDATQLDSAAALPDVVQPVILTDPPYYDNIGYAELSDFFYVWLRKGLSCIWPRLFATVLTPKSQELIASAYRHDGSREKAKAFFEERLGTAFSHMKEIHYGEYPLTVYYAFKQIETDEDDDGDDTETRHTPASTGWETMLEGTIRAGFAVSGTWPSRTEGGTRLVAMDTNALASSIVLVCRPRPAGAPVATRKELITTLRNELPEALRNLQRGNIAPVDLAQAAIGPGMAVFTRYAKVMESDGSSMRVRTALQLINQALDEVLAEQEGEFDAATRWALAWFEQHGMDEGPFGVAETLSKAKNTAVNALVEAGVITARGGKVRLVKRDELPDDWDPAADDRLTIWEATQHLIRALDKEGEAGAAALLKQLGATAEIARDLAYRLYTVCERKKWADEALAFNGLVIAWPELTRLAQAAGESAEEKQAELF